MQSLLQCKVCHACGSISLAIRVVNERMSDEKVMMLDAAMCESHAVRWHTLDN